MNKITNTTSKITLASTFFLLTFTIQSCKKATKESPQKTATKPEYYSLRPEIEKAFGYTHAVKVGDIIKVSGAVSRDDQGTPTAIGDMGQQMKNCYGSLEKILAHYNCTFDDVIVENVYTTDMPLLLENAAYRSEIYKNNFPTGSWIGVNELAVPVFMIEIELEVFKP